MSIRSLLFILLTLFVALSLYLMPSNLVAMRLRPDLVLLFLIYWSMALPHRVGIFSGFIIGLLIDAATGSLLGQHAFAYSLVLWMVLENHKRLRLALLWKQTLSVIGLLYIEQIIGAVVIGATLTTFPDLLYWLAPLFALVLWPIIFTVLRGLRRRFRVD